MPKSLFGIFFNMDNEVVQFQNLPGANGDPQGKKKKKLKYTEKYGFIIQILSISIQMVEG